MRFFLPFFLSLSSWASSQGELRWELRAFQKDELSQTRDQSSSFYGRISFKEMESLPFDFKAEAFARADPQDESRNLFWAQDLWAAWPSQSFETKVGYQIFNLSVMDVFHPLDTINSQNFEANVEEQEKRGELSVEQTFHWEKARLSFYFFPLFERPNYPGEKNRLGLLGNFNQAKWVDESQGIQTKSFAPQGGLSFSTVYHNLDLSLVFLHHIDRLNPLFKLESDATLTPLHFYSSEVALAAQTVWGNLIGKFEGSRRSYGNNEVRTTAYGARAPEDHTALALGFERGLSFTEGTELTFLLEGQAIIGPTKVRRAELSVFQRDVMVGLRYSLNNLLSSEYRFLMIYDLERNEEFLFNASYETRINDFWKTSFGLRFIQAPQKEMVATNLELFHEDHQAYFNLSRFF